MGNDLAEARIDGQEVMLTLVGSQVGPAPRSSPAHVPEGEAYAHHDSQNLVAEPRILASKSARGCRYRTREARLDHGCAANRRSQPARAHRTARDRRMTGDLEDSSQWRDSVESRLGTLETAAAEFRAQEKLIQAVAETQSDHTSRLTRLEDVQNELRTELGRVHVGVEAIQILLKGLTANETPEDDQVSANPVDADPDALP
jgi:hypothetical protein